MKVITILTTIALVAAGVGPAVAQSKDQSKDAGKGVGSVLDTLSGILTGNQKVHGNVVVTNSTTLVVRGDDRRTYALDASSLDSRMLSIVQPGDGVTVAVKGEKGKPLVATDLQLDRANNGAAKKTFHQVQGTVQQTSKSQVVFKTRDGLQLPIDVSSINGLPTLTPNEPATLIYDQGPQSQIEAVWIQPGTTQPSAGAPAGATASNDASASGSASPNTSASTGTTGSERIHGLIDSISLAGLSLQADDGRKLAVDTGKIDSRLMQALKPGDLVTVVGRTADRPGAFVAESLQPDSLK
jgi:hypothetical protein